MGKPTSRDVQQPSSRHKPHVRFPKSTISQPHQRKFKFPPNVKTFLPFGLRTLALLFLSLVLAAVSSWVQDNAIGFSHHFSPVTVDWDDRREAVRNAFVESWDAFEINAWGKDQYHPISQTGSLMSPSGLGWMIIDSLDTLMLMNLTSQLAESRKWLHRRLTWDQDQNVNTFETTIRMLGGLLSAHYLATKRLPDVSSRRDHVYLEKAIDLAERLLAAYDSPSGIPYASVNLGKKLALPSHADGGASSLAEASTLQLEMKYLSHVTGDGRYWRKAEEVMRVLDRSAARLPDGLLPIFVHPATGGFTTREIRLGSRGDSYYEYLIKQYLQTSEPIYLDMWNEALAGIQKHLIVTSEHSSLKLVAELPHGVGGPISPKMDHLVCFLPGTIALAATGGATLSEARKKAEWSSNKEAQIKLARELTTTCWGMYAVTETGLAPEIAWFNINNSENNNQDVPTWWQQRSTSTRLSSWKKDLVIKALDAHNLQRPETVETLFLMWRITGDAVYREWGWKIFQAFDKHTFLGKGKGYTSVNDVNSVPPALRDNMESFWLAETLKYLYLLFSPSDLVPLEEVVFNTEAHILPRIKERRWSTAWRSGQAR